MAGLILATRFEVAHCVEAADFTDADAARRGLRPRTWLELMGQRPVHP